MRFAPKTQEELDTENLLPAGEYDFEVFRAKDKISKTSGAEMIELGLKIYAPNGSTPFVNDYLLESMAYKLRHFCDAVGLTEKYESGDLCAHDCTGRQGIVKIVIDPAKNSYPAKNAVKDYVGLVKGAQKDFKTSHQETPFTDVKEGDEEIPF